jgi:LAO/AO transport system kinase
MVRLLDAASKDIILVETVGVGQTELGVMGVADTVLVALMPESGDTIQTLKAGVMEIADVFLVNKADREGANRMAAGITAMLQTTSEPASWPPPVMLTQADRGEGIPELWEKIKEHRNFMDSTSLGDNALSRLERRRLERRRNEFLESVEEELKQRLNALINKNPVLVQILEGIAERELEPYSAALEFLDGPGLLNSGLIADTRTP